MSANNSLKRKSDAVAPAFFAPAVVRDWHQAGSCVAHPLGEATNPATSQIAFCPQDFLTRQQEAVPAWQRDTGEALRDDQAASRERRSILTALAQSDRFGVILNAEGRVVQGSVGWTQHVSLIPAMRLNRGILLPRSGESRQEYLAGLELLFSDYNLMSVPFKLRDLDGWVTDILNIKRVGLANPNCALILLPKSQLDLVRITSNLAAGLGLTPLEEMLVRLIVKGETDREMAASISLKLSDVKRGIGQLVAKLGVRQKSDIARLIASFS